MGVRDTGLTVAGLAQPAEPLPQELAAVMRPELPSLVREIRDEIVRAIPEYAQLLEGPYGRLLEQTVDESLDAFVDRVARPHASTAHSEELCRRVGRFEAAEGRSFQQLRTALRIGARVALRRAKVVGVRYTISPATMAMFADSVFAYVDAVEAHCHEGYVSEKEDRAEELEGLRRRLLRLLLAGSTLPLAHPAVRDLADRARWPVPETVTPVATGSVRRPRTAELDADVLAEPDDPMPHYLVPGEADAARQARLVPAIGGRPLVIGVTVPTAQAADALRWARRTVALVESGVIAESPVVRCEDHLLTLWLLADPALAEELARRELAPLESVTPVRRARLVDTMRTWLTTRGTATGVAELLRVHPQTVRYRLRTLHQTFGPRLHDSERRFALEVALRARKLREGGRPPA